MSGGMAAPWVSTNAVTRVDSSFNVDVMVFNSFCMLIDGFLRCESVSLTGAYCNGRWTTRPTP